MELGSPVSYEVLATGTAVYSSDGQQIGTVAHVLADEAADIFDGVVIAEHLGSGHRFADADDIAEIHEHGVLLKLSAQDCERLPRPTENPAVMREDPSNPPAQGMAAKLRRAWDYISGDY